MELNTLTLDYIDKINKSTLKDIEKQRIISGIKKFGYNKPVIFLYRVVWEITSRCNLSCKHCSENAGNGNNHKDLNFEQIRSIMLKLKKAGITNITFTGGELFIRKDILDILQMALDYGFNYSFASNLTLINDSIIKFLSHAKPLAIQTSLDYANEEAYNNFRGNNTAFKNFLHGLKSLLNLEIPIIATCTVTKDNLKKLDEIIDFAVNQKIKIFSVNDLIPIGRGKEIKEKTLSSEEFSFLRKYIQEKKRVSEGIITITWEGISKPENRKADAHYGILKSKCISCFERLNITSSGEVQPCNLLKLNLGNILTADLEQIWEKSEIIKNMINRDNLKGKCGACEYRYSCGGCRARAYAYTGDYLGEDIRCI